MFHLFHVFRYFLASRRLCPHPSGKSGTTGTAGTSELASGLPLAVEQFGEFGVVGPLGH
jgi:hypothetical protein